MSAANTFRNESLDIEIRVDDLMSQLTWDEKLQLCSGKSLFKARGLKRLGIKPENFSLPLIYPDHDFDYNDESYNVAGNKNPASAPYPEDPCNKNAECFAQKSDIGGAIYSCKRSIERMAQYDFEWTDGIFDGPFASYYQWHDQEKKQIK